VERMRRLPCLLLVLTACASPGPGAADVDLGQGAVVYEDVSDGDALLYVEGCQGLQHVWAAFRADGLGGRRTEVAFRLRDAEDGADVAEPLAIRVNLTRLDDGRVEWTGGLLLLPDLDAVLGRPLRYEVTVRDEAGVGGHAERTVSVERARCGHCREDDPTCLE
jgi:hypothetical protein